MRETGRLDYLEMPATGGTLDAAKSFYSAYLWAQLATALKGRTVTLGTSEPSVGSPAAFAQAWADLARDKAKAAGPFASAIPKPNLAKLKLG